MQSTEDAFKLAETMVAIGKQVKRQTIAIITNMDEPLSKAIGNALEVKEAIRTLKGQGTKELEELCILIGAQMLVIGKKADNVEEAKKVLFDIIHSGRAIDMLKNLVAGQGGDPTWVDQPELLPLANKQIELYAQQSGNIAAIEAEEIGIAAMMLGAGRERKDSVIDHAVGIELAVKVGDKVKAGDSLLTIHVNSEAQLQEVMDKLYQAITISSTLVQAKPLIYGIVTDTETIRYE